MSPAAFFQSWSVVRPALSDRSLLQLFILTRILSENRFTLFGMRFDSLPTKE
jgi:hypothetical protein